MQQPAQNNLQAEHVIPRKHPQRRHHFLAAWVRSPLKIGALLPSSRALAEAMAAQVDLKVPGAVVELGAGTGVMTHALLHRGIAADRLVIIERDRKLHDILASHFPHLNVLCADAAMLDEVLAEHKVTKVSAIVSSLPLLSMPKHIRDSIQEQMAKTVADHGIIIQFTYGPKSPISRRQMRKYHLHGRRTRMVMTNVPPAHVWVYRKA